MEKQLLFFFILLCSNFLKAQSTGSLLIKCKAKNSLQAMEALAVDVYQDDSRWKGMTDSTGIVRFNKLKIGSAKILISINDVFKEQEVFIQSNQLLQHTIFIDSLNLRLEQKKTSEYKESKRGEEAENKAYTFDELEQRLNAFSNSSSQQFDEVMIVGYTSPLITKDHGIHCEIMFRNDIEQLPVRSARNISSTISAINNNESNGELNVRGARSNANQYYLDGVKVLGEPEFPKSFVDKITIYSGSIPAKYGDLTGGVIDLESKSILMRPIPQRSVSPRTEVKEIKRFNYDEFIPIYENDFLSPLNHPNSTFGLDVDQATWKYLKYSIESGLAIKRDAVKLEEMINAFHYKDVLVADDEMFNMDFTRSDCSWNRNHELLSIHLKTKDIPKDFTRKPHNLVFLIDVSGSMSSSKRLPLIIDALKQLVNKLNADDRVSIVTYAGYSGTVLTSTSCDHKEEIMKALSNLKSGGSTNGIGGIKEAYRQAEQNFDSTFNNRIILATDGDFNVGINSTGDLESYIREKRGKGIYLTALGVGMGNYKNNILEVLAKRGDGNHFYIRSLEDFAQVFNDIGNLITIARDVKMNVEFNPRLISNYRLIGYESRLLKPKDFDDDQKDGGELGYGHRLTAVYEIEKGVAGGLENHFVKQRSKNRKLSLAHVKLSYKPFSDSISTERTYEVLESQPKEKSELLNLVIAFGLELRGSVFKADLTKDKLMTHVNNFDPITQKESDLKTMIIEALKE